MVVPAQHADLAARRAQPGDDQTPERAGPTGDKHAIVAGAEGHRRRLLATAHRILASRSDAEDAVQEAWLRFSRSDTTGVHNLESWLTTVVSRICLNMLEARKSRPQAAPDSELNEPVADPAESDPEHRVLLADSIGIALLVVLDTLSPAERVAFVLHDVFAIPFDHIAPIVDRSVPATRQLASRARTRVRQQDATEEMDRLRHAALVDAFLAAAHAGDFDALLAVLDPDVVLRADEQAVALGAAPETKGANQVAAFLRGARGTRRAVLAGVAAAVWMPGGQPRVVLRMTTAGHSITAVDLIADPERLAQLDLIVPEDGR